MYILPAIDIKDGKAVRLFKGDYSTAEQVASSPYDAANSFAEAGAKWMHMVDLDGAKDAKLINADLISDVAKSSGLKVEVGGGIRNMKAVVIDAVKEYGERIVIGIDTKNGMVQAEGWLDNSEVDYIELAKRMEDVGVCTIVFTDIDCDGMLSGPNLKQLDDLTHEVSCNIIASGGVAVLKDILILSNLDIYGAICGKAIYSGNLDLRQAIEMTKKI